jgi:RNA polymerase sigma factor (sigma-70 family)
LLRLRSDDQLVELFRAGNDEAFRVIHDRYRPRLFAYTRQMLPSSRCDAEDALQDVFLKAYWGLRATDRQLALRAWLYRVAHNRCVDELRRPGPPVTLATEQAGGTMHDPIAAAEQREALSRLVADVRRLPEQQRSALLMRELGGMSYAELASTLGLSVPAVKSLLVRARVSLSRSIEARETACSTIREEIIQCHDRGVRPTGTARRHLRDCSGCRDFRRDVRGLSRHFSALVPALGPIGVMAKVLGIGGGAGGGAAAAGGGGAGGAAAGSGVAAGTGLVAAGGALGTGGAVAAGGFLSGTAGHAAALLAAAIVATGGAVELNPSSGPPLAHHTHARTAVASTVSAGSRIATADAPATYAVAPATGAGPAITPARSAGATAAADGAGHSNAASTAAATPARGAGRHGSGADETATTAGMNSMTDGMTGNDTASGWSATANPAGGQSGGISGTGSVNGTGSSAGGATSSSTGPGSSTTGATGSTTGTTGTGSTSSSTGTPGSGATTAGTGSGSGSGQSSGTASTGGTSATGASGSSSSSTGGTGSSGETRSPTTSG